MDSSFKDIKAFMDDDNSIDIKREVTKYLRYWPWFVFTVIVTVISAYIYLRYAPKIYQTTAKIKVLDESDGLELPTSAFIIKRKNINLENEIEILTSYLIVERVVRKLNLNTKFYEEGTIQTSPLEFLPFEFEQLIKSDSIINNLGYKIVVSKSKFTVSNINSEKTYDFQNHNSYTQEHGLPFQIRYDASMPFEEIEDKTFLVHFQSIKNAAFALKAKVEVEAIGDQSDLLQLSIKGESVQISEKIINTLVDTFNKDGIKDRQLVSKRTLDFVEDRFRYLAQELDSIEVGRQDFKQRNNVVDLAVDAEIGLEQRTQSGEEVFRINSQLALAKDLNNAITKDASYGLIPADIGLDNNSINNLINEYNSTVLSLDKLKSSAGKNNPSVKLAETTISVLKNNINRSLNAYVNQLKGSQSQLQSRNNRFRGQVSQIPKKEKLLLAINRQQKIKESIYLLLLQKREEAAINLAITEPSIKVVENALSGSQPISPKSNIVYAGALLGGLLIPFGVLYLMFMLDTKLHSKEDITALKIDIPVIAEIPEIKKADTKLFDDPNDRSVLAESFRILSANVDYILPIKNQEKEKGKVIYCTSTIKGEGKTYVSVNLSLALSSINKKVLLIGTDLRNPQIHNHIKQDKQKPGLSNYLHDVNYNWRDALISGFEKHPNHHIILSGSIPPNPANLLTNGRFKDLIEEAKQDYDYIIVDTAPTILVTDTMLISQLADATIYIVRANFTEKNLLNYSKDLHETGKLKNMAYVVNGVGASKSYGYSYNYGYGYGYGAKA
ncbi:GumC family protein [Winogradskyella sp. UBA3174]|uniref:GumC family protein n=1 Tax=Winogradskyella sp. UBA3174 TaxID=1947785 RepID=UPI0025E8DF52|nr:tyrosine-protein kinase family protein [Winogradskyella sp. UBA3174]|tara:strand:+ start:56084 stop:58429 length:2346 start_codon:yes stop_codon:yes gene_type:complete